MRPIKYIILNGAIGSGKTVIARELARELAVCEGAFGVAQDSFAAPIKHFFGVSLGDKFNSLNKALARPELMGYTLHAAYDDMETSMRVRYGDDCFGKWLVHRSLRNPRSLPVYVIVDDGGHAPDIEAVPNRIVIRVDRTGYTNFGGQDMPYPSPNYVFGNNRGIIQMFQQARELAVKIRAEAHVGQTLEQSEGEEDEDAES